MHIKKQVLTKQHLKKVISLSFIILVSAIFVLAFSVFAKSVNTNSGIVVSNLKELNSAISSAKPGDIIIMKNGVWSDVAIDFKSNASLVAPITLRAQTPGNVILNGKSKLIFSKPYLIADGLFFKQGAIPKGAVIEFNSDNCQLSNTAIVDYNPEKFETKYYWVYFKGNSNRVNHCYFKGKNNMQPLIGNDQDNSRHNKVDHCYIKDIPYVNQNGREIFRIWGNGRSEDLGADGAFFTIEYNLFERAHGEGMEIVSLKSNHNIVCFNTVRASRGGFVGRSGNFNTFEGNFILGENTKGSTGIRVAGQNHRVINNYISDISGDGLMLVAGEYIDKYLTKDWIPISRPGTALGRVPSYGQVKNGLFAHNTLINIGKYGIDFGSNYKSRWSVNQLVLLPENNLIINNLIMNCKSGTAINIPIQDKNPPLDFLTFQPNKFEGNIVFGGKVNIDPLLSGIKTIDPMLQLESDGLYRPVKNSPVINSGVNSDVTNDMDGQKRGRQKDVCTDEYSKAPVIRHPLTANDVGPVWIITRRKAGENF